MAVLYIVYKVSVQASERRRVKCNEVLAHTLIFIKGIHIHEVSSASEREREATLVMCMWYRCAGFLPAGNMSMQAME